MVEDDSLMEAFIVDSLRVLDCDIIRCSTCREARERLRRSSPDLVLTDLRLPDGSGMELVKYLRNCSSTVPIIVMTAYPDPSLVHPADELDISSFLIKPFSPEQIRYSVLQGLEKRHNNHISKAAVTSSNNNSHGLIGVSRYIHDVRQKILRVARNELPVIIQGPSGTGKEIIAQALHASCERGEHTLIAVNCATIPPHLEEAELFGCTKGSFTGAVHDRDGIIASAHQSTLFLDEVGELSLATQAKLLRVLDSGEVTRIGAVQPSRVDIRVVAATNRSLDDMVANGDFRHDLYFRLKGEVIQTKSLADHREDTPALVHHFIATHTCPNTPDSITTDALRYLSTCSWPGNIRELKHTVIKLCHAAEGLKRITLPIVEKVSPRQKELPAARWDYRFARDTAIMEFEYGYFEKLLAQYRGNLSQVSDVCGIERRNLSKKLKALNLSPEEFRAVL